MYKCEACGGEIVTLETLRNSSRTTVEHLLEEDTTDSELRKMGADNLLEYITPPGQLSFVVWTDIDLVLAIVTAFLSIFAVASMTVFGIVVGLLVVVAGLSYFVHKLITPSRWYFRFSEKYYEYSLCLNEGVIVDLKGEQIGFPSFLGFLKELTREA